MVQSLKRGWKFLQQAWQMACKDRDLLKPSIFALFTGFAVTTLGLIPLVGAGLLIGEATWLGQTVMVLIGGGLLFAQHVVGYVFSGMTVYLIFGYLAEGDGRIDVAWSKVQRELWDIVSLAAASTLVKLVAGRLRRGNRQRAATGAIGGMLASILQSVWTEASYLILPAIMIEDANLVMAIKRATQIAKNNLLLVGISTIGVRWITGFIGLVSAVIGLALGLVVGYGIINAIGASTLGLILGIGFGALILFAFITVASITNSYTTTAYHTCLFLWARDVERAQIAGQPIQVAAPAPLAHALAEG